MTFPTHSQGLYFFPSLLPQGGNKREPENEVVGCRVESPGSYFRLNLGIPWFYTIDTVPCYMITFTVVIWIVTLGKVLRYIQIMAVKKTISSDQTSLLTDKIICSDTFYPTPSIALQLHTCRLVIFPYKSFPYFLSYFYSALLIFVGLYCIVLWTKSGRARLVSLGNRGEVNRVNYNLEYWVKHILVLLNYCFSSV